MNEETHSENTDEPRTLTLETVPLTAIVRAEVDCQIATAKQYPRSFAKFLKRAEEMVLLDEETARSCFYQLRRWDKKKGEWVMIEGESIRMAEIVVACYGNLRIDARIIDQTPTRVTVRAACHDLEANNMIASELQTKTTYKTGEPLPEDVAVMLANGLISKGIRNSVFRIVPRALVRRLRVKARDVANKEDGAIPFDDRRKKAVAWAESKGVDMKRFFAALGVAGEADITTDQLELLTGLRQSIKDNELTLDQAFPMLNDRDDAPISPKDHPKTTQPTQTTAPSMADPTTASASAPAAAAQPAEEKKKRSKKEAATPAVTATEPQPAITIADKPADPAVDDEPLRTQPPQEEAEQPSRNRLSFVEPEAAPEPAEETSLGNILAEVDDLTPEQEKMKTIFEMNGLSFADFFGWATDKKTITPPIPSTWGQIPDAKCEHYVKHFKAMEAGINKWKADKNK